MCTGVYGPRAGLAPAAGRAAELRLLPMHISVAWLNAYLDRPVTPDEAETILTGAGFPIESRTDRTDGDVMLDVEVTSNRGDVLSHVGCAREIAAASGRRLSPPRAASPGAGVPISTHLRLENREPAACPRFTARVVLGARVGPSPQWLVRALESVGQRSINNVVDVTNWLNFALGQPAHAFDLDRLAGSTLVVRFAGEGEPLRTLDGKSRTLRATDLVVADAHRAQSLAGVIGGADSEVGPGTTNIVLEVATWDPATVRAAARRLGIRTDASHRFERRVHPATIDEPARLAAAMIAELSGGTPSEGSLDAGGQALPTTPVAMRTSRCRAILGHPIADQRMVEILGALGIAARLDAGRDVIEADIPPHRHDLEREIDLIEEVARIAGYDLVPTLPTLPVAIRPPQEPELLRDRVGQALTGLGFFETVTFSFLRPQDAADFLPPGLSRIDVDDERRGEEPTLRPSIIPSLIRCRKANQDSQAEQPGGVRLFEVASVYAATGPTTHIETRNLALLMDVHGAGKRRTYEDLERAVRLLRGAIDQVLSAAGIPHTHLAVCPMDEGRKVHPACEAAASAMLLLADSPLGYMALLGREAQQRYGLEFPVVYAELGMAPLESADRPAREVHSLPQFPAIDRDLSVVLEEGVLWADIAGVVGQVPIPTLESLRYVGTFRDPEKLGKGRKSVTLRIRFRAPDRTLRHEDADAPIADLVARFHRELGGVLRS